MNHPSSVIPSIDGKNTSSYATPYSSGRRRMGVRVERAKRSAIPLMNSLACVSFMTCFFHRLEEFFHAARRLEVIGQTHPAGFSNLLGCSTGRSAGFYSLKTRGLRYRCDRWDPQ